MTATPSDRLNQAAVLLGLSDRLAPDCGHMQWSDVQSRIILALAERMQSQVAPVAEALTAAAQALTAAIENGPRRAPTARKLRK